MNEYLYEKIAEELSNRIYSGELKVNDSLPTIDRICRTYGVSHLTVRHSLKELIRYGIVRKCGRSFRVTERSRTIESQLEQEMVGNTIGLFVRPHRPYNQDDNLFNNINTAMEETLSENSMDYLRSHVLSILNTLMPDASGEFVKRGEILRQLQIMSRHVCGLVIDERISDRLLETFLSQNRIPMILLNRETALPISSVVIQNRQGIDYLLCHASQRYTDIIYIGVRAKCYPNDCKRFEIMREYFDSGARNDFKVHLFDTERAFTDQFDQILALMKPNKKRRRILLMCTSDIIAIEMLAVLTRHNFKLGPDFGICGFYGTAAPLEDGRILTSIRFNAQKMGETAIRQLLKQIKHPWYRSKVDCEISPELIIGNTM
ncbi:GntR family transcriptional regulator [Victivallis sp. Marseille-Q1083]|uniref:GntR family transcriptional regulator n=1 Tax=Victivallis sp. Marseille-Q1083 TaxID=2717288 RepID=UPI00158D23E0|nr:GntR family transcriptional regulator [Victivallis sp. Marseille-Q1083]